MATQTKDIEVLDIAQLKSGGPGMLVTALSNPFNGEVECAWANGNRIERAMFHVDALKWISVYKRGRRGISRISLFLSNVDEDIESKIPEEWQSLFKWHTWRIREMLRQVLAEMPVGERSVSEDE